MKEIVCVIRPFDVQQSIYCFEDGQRIDAVNAKLDTIADTVISLMKKHETQSINMIGSKNFSEKYGNDILKKASTEYNLGKVTIQYSSSKGR